MNSLKQAACSAAVVLTGWGAALGQTTDSISELLQPRQLDLATDGKAFLLNEAGRASFLLIGGLHGDQETPALVQSLSAGAAQFGYRDLVVEMSPWAAGRLEGSLNSQSTAARIKGADIEEVQPQLVIRDLASANPGNRALQSMVEITRGGYRRAAAGQLLQLTRDVGDVKDVTVGGFSLYTLVLRTLDVESARASNQRFDASTRREAFMKELFIHHYRAAARGQTKPKFVVSFGQGHLGRGIDGRGVSTLGNFVGELAVAEGVQSFHVLLFAAGGKYSLRGIHDIDQRKDEAGFAFLASLARYPATVFDVRTIRPALHNLPAPLTSRDANLLYWADSYDAIVCYREVTPLGGIPTK
jgi:hypothetical protein